MADLHACAVDADGNVVCWGDGRSGALGYGTTDSRGDAADRLHDASAVLRRPHFEDVTWAPDGHARGPRMGAVRCWGSLLSHGNGRIYGDTESASVGPTFSSVAQYQLLGPASARAAVRASSSTARASGVGATRRQLGGARPGARFGDRRRRAAEHLSGSGHRP
ncbi:MAG: hypothetical protein H6745_16640 [Deltaproteobacteria bacterium]|nr:hypothetical protein [Deltaproteobacteria bacterium]